MIFHPTPADIALVVAVTGMAVGMAYLHSPRAKSLVYMLPIPFSLALISTGRGIDATHMVGMGAVWIFLWVVWLLHSVAGLNIIVADLAAIAIHAAGSLALARALPAAGSRGEPPWFWGSCAAVAVVSLCALLPRTRGERGHRSDMPVYVKAPLVLVLVACLIAAKEPLRGFMPSFPMASVFAVYEARHSLKTLTMRFPIFMFGFAGMAAVLRILLPARGPIAAVDFLLPLAASWAVYVPIYLAMDKWHSRRAAADNGGARKEA